MTCKYLYDTFCELHGDIVSGSVCATCRSHMPIEEDPEDMPTMCNNALEGAEFINDECLPQGAKFPRDARTRARKGGF